MCGKDVYGSYASCTLSELRCAAAVVLSVTIVTIYLDNGYLCE